MYILTILGIYIKSFIIKLLNKLLLNKINKAQIRDSCV